VAVTAVLFDGVAETPITATLQQVNVSTPGTLTGRVSTEVQLEFATGRTPTVTIGVSDADPALFTDGSGRAAVWEQAEGVIALFGTGFGPGAVTVEVGGRPAEVLYAAPAPGLLPGVTQINIRVPSGTAPGAVFVVRSGARVSSQRTYL
jgi:uncharacterized protein (TIGR03437 family)